MHAVTWRKVKKLMDRWTTNNLLAQRGAFETLRKRRRGPARVRKRIQVAQPFDMTTDPLPGVLTIPNSGLQVFQILEENIHNRGQIMLQVPVQKRPISVETETVFRINKLRIQSTKGTPLH